MEDDSTIVRSVLVPISAGLFGLFWTLTLAPHIYRIWKPSIVAYPWDEGTNATTTTTSKNRENKCTVIFAASYNPPHKGHLRMLEYLSQNYDRVIAVVGFNPNKKYLVSPEERANLLREMLQMQSKTENVKVEVVEGYIWRYAKRIGANLFFRGIRSWEKDGRDERNLQILNTWGPLVFGPLAIPISTIYIEGDPKYNHVSSTLIRKICSGSSSNNEKDRDDEQTRNTEAALSELVPSGVAGKVANLYGAKE